MQLGVGTMGQLAAGPGQIEHVSSLWRIRLSMETYGITCCSSIGNDPKQKNTTQYLDSEDLEYTSKEFLSVVPSKYQVRPRPRAFAPAAPGSWGACPPHL